MGHIHLRVAEIPATAAFYCDALGFALMAAFGAQAAFMSAGGYHHHVGANTWESRGAGPAPPGHATLERATIVLPTAGDVDRLAHEVAVLGQEPRAARRRPGRARPRPVGQPGGADRRRLSRGYAAAPPNSRGSFVMIPVTPRRSSLAIRSASSTVHT